MVSSNKASVPLLRALSIRSCHIGWASAGTTAAVSHRARLLRRWESFEGETLADHSAQGESDKVHSIHTEGVQ